MRLTLQLWHWELDVTLGPASDTTPDDEGAALNGGTLGCSEIVGFGSVLWDTGSVQWSEPEE